MPQGLTLSCFSAVLFDIDGTLVDSLSMLIRGLGDTYERYSGSRPPDEEIQKLIGLPLREQMRYFRAEPPSPELQAEMMSHTLERFKAHESLESQFDAAVEALHACHRAGIKTALVTSKSDVELAPFLQRFSGSAWIHTAVCASDVSQPKPDPECTRLACERLGVDPSEAVFIGDSVFDLRSGRDAGAKTAAVFYGSGEREALLAESPDLVFETPEALLDWVNESLLSPPCHERK